MVMLEIFVFGSWATPVRVFMVDSPLWTSSFLIMPFGVPSSLSTLVTSVGSVRVRLSSVPLLVICLVAVARESWALRKAAFARVVAALAVSVVAAWVSWVVAVVVAWVSWVVAVVGVALLF